MAHMVSKRGLTVSWELGQTPELEASSSAGRPPYLQLRLIAWTSSQRGVCVPRGEIPQDRKWNLTVFKKPRSAHSIAFSPIYRSAQP